MYIKTCHTSIPHMYFNVSIADSVMNSCSCELCCQFTKTCAKKINVYNLRDSKKNK